MSEELKPCPFCGGPAESRNGNVFCSKKPWCSGNAWAWFEENWQDAYCWKEIDRLKAQLAEKEKELEAYKKAKAENDERFQLSAGEWKARFEAAVEVTIANHYDKEDCHGCNLKDEDIRQDFLEQIESRLKERSE